MDFDDEQDEEYDEGMEGEMEGEDGYDDGEEMEGDDGAAPGGMPSNQAAMLQQMLRAQQGQQKKDKLKPLHQFGLVKFNLGDLFNLQKTDVLLAGAGFLMCFKESALQPVVIGAVVLRWMLRRGQVLTKPERLQEAAQDTHKELQALSGATVESEKTVADIEAVLAQDSWRPELQGAFQAYKRAKNLFNKLSKAAQEAQDNGESLELDSDTSEELKWFRSKFDVEKMDAPEAVAAASKTDLATLLQCYKFHQQITAPPPKPRRGPLRILGRLLGSVRNGFSRLVHREPQWYGDSEWLNLPTAPDEDGWLDMQKARERKAALAAKANPAPGPGLPGMGMPGMGGGLPAMFQSMFGGMGRG